MKQLAEAQIAVRRALSIVEVRMSSAIRWLSVLLVLIAVGGCTTISLNDDNTNTITHKAGAGVGQELGDRACRRAGERHAVIISTVNKDPSLPEGEGRQVTTFRCTSSEPTPGS